ncbi:MAG TPA: 4a-hydroxytetrahydrobiopterin dehydratase [Longimicrobiales bacterium]|nr:4a-hydroxytetrahydrobiopterin dehydratase [Longimicrobiales bacterium]
MRTLLDDATIQNWLAAHPGWSRAGDTIEKTFTFPSFMEAVAFVQRAAIRAEEMDHHPDLDIRYDKVRVGLSTHSAGGITEMDTGLGDKLEGAARG